MAAVAGGSKKGGTAEGNAFKGTSLVSHHTGDLVILVSRKKAKGGRQRRLTGAAARAGTS